MTSENIFWDVYENLKKSISKLIVDTLVAISNDQAPVYPLRHIVLANQEMNNVVSLQTIHHPFESFSSSTIMILRDLAEKEIQKLNSDYLPMRHEINSLQLFVDFCNSDKN